MLSRSWLVLAVLALPAAAAAQEGVAVIGGSVRGGRPDSGDVLRYTDVPHGLAVPRLELRGEALGLDYALRAVDVRERDQALALDLARDRFRLALRFDRLPRFGDAARTPYQEVGYALRLPDAAQAGLQSALEARQATLDPAAVAALLDPLAREARRLRTGIQRDTWGVVAEGRPAGSLRLSARYTRAERAGTRRGGVGFGLANAVEVAEPVDDVTQAVTLGGEWARGWGSLAASVRYDHFGQRASTFAVDNPLRATDATAPRAFLGPGPSSIAGAADALVALPPSSAALAGTLRATARLPGRTRLTAHGGLARWTRSGAAPPPTTNDAIAWPGTAPSELDGRVAIQRAGVQLSSSPWTRITVRANARVEERDNDTARFDLPGVARLDAALEEVARRTVPYAHDQARLEVAATGRVGGWSLEASHRRHRVEREFRETDRTDESAWAGALLGRLTGDARLRLSWERARREFGVYDNRRSTEASRLVARPPRVLGAARRYDQAIRDRDRARAALEWEASRDVALTLAWAVDRRDYPGSAYGLVRTRGQEAAADVSVAPEHGRWEAHASGGWERLGSVQRTRHSPAPQISVDLRNVWDADLAEDVVTVAAGGSLRAGRLTVRLDGDLQAADGLADLYSAPGGIPDVGEPIAAFGDTRFARATLEVERALSGRVSAGVGAWWESWTVRDVPEEPGAPVVAGALVLSAPERDGRIGGAYLRLAVRF